MSEDDVLFGYRLQLFDHAARTSVSGIRGMVAGTDNCQDCHGAHFADKANLITSTVAPPSE